MLTPLSNLVGRRLTGVMDTLDMTQKELAGRIPSHALHRVGQAIQPSLVARWISGLRDPTPYFEDIFQALIPDMTRAWSATEARQEVLDAMGLSGIPLTPAWEKRLHRWFPDSLPPVWTAPATWQELPAAQLPRPQLVTDVLMRLFDPDANALFRRTGVALTGPAGGSKTWLARETVLAARPFFAGGILYGDLGERSPDDILESWAGDLGLDSQKKREFRASGHRNLPRHENPRRPVAVCSGLGCRLP